MSETAAVDYHPPTPARLPKLAVTAVIVAFLLVLAGLLLAFQHVVLVISAVVPAIAAVTILRRRVWGAYGFALFELAQAALTLLLFRVSSLPTGRLVLSAGLGLAFAVLFFLAGRSLRAAGAERGAVYPWIVISCLFTLPLLFIRGYGTPTGSMEDTLLRGDWIVARTFPPVTPARGEIIVFRYPVDKSQTFLKRVIGVPGDRIKLVNNVGYRNGIKLDEPYVTHKLQFPNSYAENFPSEKPHSLGQLDPFVRDMFDHHIERGEVVVPASKFFVLGDNRENSLDSRFWGFVDASDIIGKALFIYDSEVPKEDIGPQTTLMHRARWNRIFKVL